MTSLFFNFVKRAIVFPLIIVVILSALLSVAINRQVQATSNIGVHKTVEVNMDDYSPKEYNEFSELKSGRYALTLNGGKFECAVLYDNVDEQNDISNLFYLNSSSTEPWNNGCVKIMSDSWYQISRLLDVKMGDIIEGDFYHSDDINETDTTVYRYKVKEIMNNKSAKAISKYNEPDTMLICASYENLADKNQKAYYVIVAELED